MATTRMDMEIMDFLKENPDSGLYEISNHIYAMHREDYDRYLDDGLKNCRTKVSKRIKSLLAYRFIATENPDGKRAIYRIRED